MRLARVFALLSRWRMVAFAAGLTVLLSTESSVAAPKPAAPQRPGVAALSAGPFGAFAALTAAGIQSDEFNAPSLDTSVWTWVDPVGDSSLTMTGSHAAIGVPAGSRHDLWTAANEVPALLQSASNEDFEIEAKFDNAVGAQYQLQGFLVVGDSANLLRLETHHDGSGTRLFAAALVGGTASVLHYSSISGTQPLYFRVQRTGSTWRLKHSADGVSWMVGATFTQALTVTQVGVFAGNSGSPPPGFTSSVDYFRELSDNTAPAIAELAGSPSPIGGTITWTTDEPATAQIAWGADTSYAAGTLTYSRLAASHRIALHGLTCGSTYHYQVRSRDATGNEARSPDQTLVTGTCPTAVSSDEFNGSVLDTSLWTYADPVGDVPLSMDGSHAVLSLPSGTRHDLWTGANEVPVLLQAAPNQDFEVEAKFDSSVAFRYQSQGILVEQDPGNLLRIEVHHDGASPFLFVAAMANGTASMVHSAPIAAMSPLYLRLKRTGDSWRVRASEDGDVWTASATFTHALAVTAVGPFAGNGGDPPPAFTARIDHFRDIPPDTTPPVVTGVSSTPGAIAAQIAWSTDERAASRVDYGTTASYGFSTSRDTSTRSHLVLVTGLGCGTTYHYEVVSADAGGNEARSGDRTFTTSACPPSLTSDEFNDASIDSDLWTYVDPLGDAQATANGSQAVISVAAGTRHDLWTGVDEVPRLMQAAPDDDFELEVKLDEPVTTRYQMQGLLVQQDPRNLLRLEVHHDGGATYLFAADISTGGATTVVQSQVTGGAPVYLRLKRKGSTWTLRHSSDAETWTSRTFTKAMNVHAVGVFAGNSGGAPPVFASEVDYFRYIPPDRTPPQLSGIAIAPGPIGAEVTWTTDEPATSTVAYGRTTAYDEGVAEVPGERRTHSVLLHGLRCGTLYHLQIRSADAEANVGLSSDRTFSTTACPEGLTTDEFDSTSINTGLWTFFDPLDDATVSADGSHASIAVPAGTVHDIWTTTDTVPRLLQAAPDTNFEVIAKFDSTVMTRYQQQGIIVEGEGREVLRFEIHNEGTETKLFVAAITPTAAGVKFQGAVPTGAATYLQLKRVGASWTLRYSTNGESWPIAVRFDEDVSATAIGPFAGNAGGTPPAFTASVDYFRVVPPPPPDLTAPALTSIASLTHRTSATITWSTDELAVSSVEWGATTGYGQPWVQAGQLTAQRARITGLTCGQTYHYRVHSTDAAGNEAVSSDRTFTTAECSAAPSIRIWRGSPQVFGTVGVPQQWINVLGNVEDPDGIASLTYRVNGGPVRNVSVGPSDDRLAYQGDFNVEIHYTELLPGLNNVDITAWDPAGNTTTRRVEVDWQGVREDQTLRSWPMPYVATFPTTASIDLQAQIFEGQWTHDGNGIRPVSTGFDRVITLGDMNWTDYEVTAEMTFNSFDERPIVGAAAGLAVGWQGHSDWGQPKFGHPSGGLCLYSYNEPDPLKYRMQLGYSPGPAHDTVVDWENADLPLGVPHTMRFRERDLGNGSTRYSCKLWPTGTPEPATWLLESDIPHWEGETGTHRGSIVLVAHHADVTFGTVTVAPID